MNKYKFKTLNYFLRKISKAAFYSIFIVKIIWSKTLEFFISYSFLDINWENYINSIIFCFFKNGNDKTIYLIKCYENWIIQCVLKYTVKW